MLSFKDTSRGRKQWNHEREKLRSCWVADALNEKDTIFRKIQEGSEEPDQESL